MKRSITASIAASGSLALFYWSLRTQSVAAGKVSDNGADKPLQRDEAVVAPVSSEPIFEQDASGPSFESQLMQSTEAHYREIRGEVSTFAAVGVFFAGVAQVIDNLPRSPAVNVFEDFAFTSGLSAADATVVVVGVLTVVAALSIALSAGGHQPSAARSPSDYSAQAVWASLTVYVSALASAISFSVAIMQFLAPASDRRPILAAFLVALAILTLLLTAAVRTWSGREALLIADRQRRIDRLLLMEKDWTGVRPNRALARYAAFVVGGGLLTSGLILAERLVFGRGFYDDWLDLGLSCSIFSVTIWAIAAATVNRWGNAASVSPLTRWASVFPEASVVISACLVYVAAGSVGQSLEAWTYATTAFLGSVAFPWLLLRQAKGRELPPVAFAAQRHVRWLQAEKRRLHQLLAESADVKVNGP